MKKKEKIPEKFYFDIKLECMVPTTITYRVFAESPEKALELINYQNPTGVKHKIAAKKDLKMIVYDAGTLMIKLVKNVFK